MDWWVVLLVVLYHVGSDILIDNAISLFYSIAESFCSFRQNDTLV